MWTFARTLRDRLRALINRDGVSQEIREEIEFHVEMRQADYRRRGLSDAEARDATRRRVGNVAAIRDQGYDVRGGGVMETIRQDIRYALRLLRKQAGFSIVAVITLALGIGATTAIFSVIDAVLLRPLPYPHPEQLVTVLLDAPGGNPKRRPVPAYLNVQDWRQLPGVFTHVATFKNESAVVIEGSEPERLSVLRISADYLSMYGAPLTAGRMFTDDDQRLNAEPVVILGYSYWLRQFAGNRDVIGRQLHFSGSTATIVGVAGSTFDSTTPLYRPLQLTDAGARARQFRVLARLRAGITIPQAERALNEQAARIAVDRPDMAGMGVVLQSMYDYVTTGQWTTLRVLLAAVLCVLLIACVNVAGLQFARGATRYHELAVRASIGAGRWRLCRQLLTESLVLAVVAGGLGLLAATLTLGTIKANLPIYSQSDQPIAINGRVLAVAAGLAMLTGLIFGIAPALRLSRVRIGQVLARSSRGHGSALTRRTGRALIAIEVALAVVLLAGGGLMIRSFTQLLAVDLGFGASDIVTVEATPVDSSQQAYANYYAAVIDRIRAIPGVAAVGATDSLPLAGSYSVASVDVEGRREAIEIRKVAGRYIEAMEIPVIAGRSFDETLDAAGSPALLNEAGARKLFGVASPIGRQVTLNNVAREIVGVVGNVRHLGPSSPVSAELYVPAASGAQSFSVSGQAQGLALIIVVQLSGPIAGLADRLRHVAQETGQPAIVRRIRSGDDWLSAAVTTPRQRTVLLGTLGAMGLVLALVGIFGTTAYMVARRVQEIGVRMAFGAGPGQVVSAIVRDAMVPLALGVTLGLAGAALATRVVESFLFGVSPRDPGTFVAVAAVLGVAGLLAAWLPARRAARVDPVQALRAE